MNGLISLLPWLVSLLAASSIVGMQMIGGGGLPMFPLLVCYLPIVVAAVLAMAFVLISDGLSVPRRISLFSMLFVGAYLLARTCFDGDQGLRDFELLRLGAVFILYLFFAVSVTRSGPRLFFVVLLLASGFLQTALEIYQFYFDGSFYPARLILPQIANFFPSAVGTFANKNHLAWVLGDTTLFALALGCWGRFRWGVRACFVFIAAFSAFGVILSLSRGGLVAMAAGFLCFCLLSLFLLVTSSDRGLLLRGLTVGLLIVLVGSLTFSLLMGNAQVFNCMQGLWMDYFREELWRASAHDLGIAPFFGLGPGSFQYSARLMMPAEALLAHDDFVQLLSEYGLVGLILVLMVLGIHLWGGFRAFFRTYNPNSSSLVGRGPWSIKRALLLGALSVALAQTVHSFLDFNMHLGASALITGAVFGILCNPGFQRARHEPSERRVHWGCAFSLCVLFSLLTGLLLKNWQAEKHFFGARQAELSSSSLSVRDELNRSVDFARLACNEAPLNPRYARTLGNLLWIRSMASDDPDDISRDVQSAALALYHGTLVDPEDWFMRMRLGEVLAKSGDESRAREEFLKADQRMPLYALPYQEYAFSLEGLGNYEEALHYYLLSERFHDSGNISDQLKHLEKLMHERGVKAEIGE